MEFIAPRWDDIYDMTIDLAENVRLRGFKADVIVGISRGGWIPARILSDLLDNPNTASMKVEFYQGIGETGEKPIITQQIQVDLSGKNVLLVDDVADSGASLKLAVSHVAEKGASKILSATLYFKPRSIFRPAIYVRDTSAWIIFPWERAEATRKIYEKSRKDGLSLADVKNTLTASGVPVVAAERIIELVSGET